MEESNDILDRSLVTYRLGNAKFFAKLTHIPHRTCNQLGEIPNPQPYDSGCAQTIQNWSNIGNGFGSVNLCDIIDTKLCLGFRSDFFPNQKLCPPLSPNSSAMKN